MPCDIRKYPPDWKTFSAGIRFVRAQQRCECIGQCGLHQPNLFARRCVERHQTKARYFKGTVHLTTAHLCKCSPPCADPNHVIAACQRCHLRMDSKRKAATRRARRAAEILPFQEQLGTIVKIT